MAVASQERNKQRHAFVDNYSGGVVLVAVHSHRGIGNVCQQVVVDGFRGDYCVLGRAVHACSSAAVGACITVKKNIQ